MGVSREGLSLQGCEWWHIRLGWIWGEVDVFDGKDVIGRVLAVDQRVVAWNVEVGTIIQDDLVTSEEGKGFGEGEGRKGDGQDSEGELHDG